MSLHDNSSGDSSPIGFLFILPWWLSGPILLVMCGLFLYNCNYEAEHMDEWQVEASDLADAWVDRAYGGGEILSMRHEKGKIFHFNAKVASSGEVVAFDCEVQGRPCEACNQ